MTKEFDIIVYGASGFTGRLVAEYLSGQYGNGGAVKWAMAGRSAAKLAAVREEIGAPAETPLVVADADDPASLDAMVARTACVITTVGPYQLYGEPLVAACARAGTGYVDLCGEPAWMRQMIDKYDSQARASGAHIVFSCGFDSIPSDLGILFLQQRAATSLGGPADRVRGRVRVMKGSVSGGTVASLKATMAAAADPQVRALLTNHFALTPGFEGPAQPSGLKPIHDDDLGSWAAPFIMAAINTRNVHRSNFLLGHPYGSGFTYDEMVMTGPGEKGEKTAHHVANDKSMSSDDAPKPGEGPGREERENGSFDMLFIGERTGTPGKVMVSVKGDRDPGYGSTSKMIAESAVCLVKDCQDAPAGIATPAAAMGKALIRRLQDNAGLTFTVEG